MLTALRKSPLLLCFSLFMGEGARSMYIHRIKKGTYLLRDSYRDGRRVRQITYLNLSSWSSERITRLAQELESWRKGDRHAVDRILALLEGQQALAVRIIRRGKDVYNWDYFEADQHLYWQIRVALERKPYARKAQAMVI